MATSQVTISVHPTSYDTEHYAWDSIVSGYPIENGYADSDSTTQARFNWVKGNQAETYIYYKFNFSSIPADARIISVTGKAKGYVNTATSGRVAAREIQFATGTTLKGTAEELTSTVTEFTFSDVGSWTRAELLDAGVRFYVRRNASGATSTFYLRVYGATMTVTYEVSAPDSPIRVKQNGSWVTPTKVLVKDNGSWTEATKILVKDGGEWK